MVTSAASRTASALALALITAACVGVRSDYTPPFDAGRGAGVAERIDDVGGGEIGDEADGATGDAAPSDAATSDAQFDVETTHETGLDARHDADTEEDRIAALGAPGGARVGYRTASLTYPRPDNREPRTLRVVVWYPTIDEDGPTPLYFGVFPRPGVIEDAALAINASAPVLVYSHGHGGYAESSPDLVEHFASHGWIVIAPDHTGNTTADIATPRTAPIYHLRSSDISATLNWLAQLEDDPLAGIARQRVVGVGHSFGGYTMATLVGATFDRQRLVGCDLPIVGDPFCAEWTPTQRAVFEAGLDDDRIVAAILMAAGNFSELGDDGVADIGTPVLMMTGGLDNDVPNATNGDRYWGALPPGDKLRVNLPRGCHQTFGLGCGLPAEIRPADGYRIINTYALAFARRWAFDEREHDGLLGGDVQPFDGEEVEISVK